jgi:hypothetical protein
MKSICMTVFSLTALLASADVRAAEPDGCLHPTWCPAPSTDWSRDLLDSALAFDVETLTGRATITLVPSMTSTGASFDVRGLQVRDVHGPLGPLQFAVSAGRLDVGVPLGTAWLTIDYDFALQATTRGLSSSGSTYTWPYFCGNLFPCKPDTDDGQSFSIDVTGVPEGKTAVFPAVIPANAPAYVPAFALGAYTRLELGTTPSGTRVSAWVLPGGEARARVGTARLVDAFAFFEHTLGAHTFGPEVGAVQAAAAGAGMEHSPYYHLDSSAMGNPDSHFHEAVHAWFGNGVRMHCWEDFALSEGNATYWAARAMEATYGVEAADELWAEYQSTYDFYTGFGIDKVLSPPTCNQINMGSHYLRTGFTYAKGALFLRALEQRVGRVAFDQAMSVFYMWNVGQASDMDELVETVAWVSGVEIGDLAQLWLYETVMGELPDWFDPFQE